ncbi:MAG TPA: TylF/MycF/NovP-related O-methyltransferase [Verrucomicrobiae bacterium]|nr:TylF/MycF/NovP-related O-methyltransferase [Verrucomicrobiae bacterium]
MIKRLIKKAVAQLGYEIQKKGASRSLGFDMENAAEELIRRVRAYTMLSRERLVTLYQQVVHCERNAIPGDFVECGVWKGGAVALMALANLESGIRPGIFISLMRSLRSVNPTPKLMARRQFARQESGASRAQPMEN